MPPRVEKTMGRNAFPGDGAGEVFIVCNLGHPAPRRRIPRTGFVRSRPGGSFHEPTARPQPTCTASCRLTHAMCAAARADERGLGVVLSVEADERGLGDSDEDGGEGGEDGEAVSWQAALRALLWSVYIPGTIRALGQMSLDPFVPLFAKRWGATVSEAGVVSSLSFAANALCSPVAGILVAKTGASCAMLVGVTVNIGAALLGGVSPSVFGLSVSRGLTGAGNGVFQVGRQVSLTNDVPNALRGRVQSLQVRL